MGDLERITGQILSQSSQAGSAQPIVINPPISSSGTEDKDKTAKPASTLISPPVKPQNISFQWQECVLGPEQYDKLVATGVQPKVTKIYYFPHKDEKAQIAILKHDFKVTEAQLVKVDSKDKRKLVFTFTDNNFSHLPFPSLPKADERSGIGKSQAQVALRAAGMDSDLPGTFTLRFNFEENSNKIKDFFIYWIGRDSQDNALDPILIGGRVMNKDGEPEKIKVGDPPKAVKDAQIALNRLLQSSGYLPVIMNAEYFEEASIQAVYTYLLSHQTLLQPNKDEAKAILKSYVKKLKKKSENYMLILHDSSIPDELRWKQLADIYSEILQLNTRIYGTAQQYIEQFSDDPKLQAVFKKSQEYATRNFTSMAHGYLGYKADLEELKPFFITAELDPALKKLDSYFEEKKKPNADKKALDAEFNRVGSSFEDIYQRLHEMERDYAFVPGIKERCVALRKQVREALEKARGERKQEEEQKLFTQITDRLDKIDREQKAKLPDEEGRYNIMYDKADRFVTEDAERKEQKPEDVRRRHMKALYLSDEILKDDPARQLVISLFSQYLREGDIPLAEVLEKFDKLVEEMSEQEFKAVGREIWLEQSYYSRGYSSDEVKKKTASAREPAQAANSKINRICKDSENPAQGEKVKESLRNLIYIFYNLQTTHNRYAKAHKDTETEITFKGANALMQAVGRALPANKKESRKIFDILGKLPETQQLARLSLAPLALKAQYQAQETGHFANPVEAGRFDKKAQELTLAPRFFGHLAQKAGTSMSQPFSGADIAHFYPSQQGIIDPAGVFHVGRQPGTDKTVFIPVEGGLPYLRESNFSGVMTTRDIAEALGMNGAAMINLALAGKTSATGTLYLQTQGIPVDAIGPATIDGLIEAAGQGSYFEIIGGLNLPQYQHLILKKALDFQGDNGLTDAEKTLLRRVLRREEKFTPAEADIILNTIIAKKLMVPNPKSKGDNDKYIYLKPSNLTPLEQLVFKKAVAGLNSALTYHFERKAGLNTEETATLKKMSEYATRHQFVIPGGRFSLGGRFQMALDFHTEDPPTHIIDKIPEHERKAFTDCYKATVLIFQKCHFQLQKMATLYMPEEIISDTMWGHYGHFWHGVKKGMKEVIFAPKMSSFQIAGLPPIQILEVKAAIHADRYEKMQVKIKYFAALRDRVEQEGSGALNTADKKPNFTEAQKAEMRAHFGVKSDKELGKVFNKIKAAAATAENLKKAMEALKSAHDKAHAEIERLGKEIEKIKDQNKGLYNEEAAGFYTNDYEQYINDKGDKNNKEANEMFRKKRALTAIRSRLNQLTEMSRAYTDDPVSVLAQVSMIKSIAVELRDGADTHEAFNATEKTAFNENISEVYTGAKTLEAANRNFIRWQELKQETEISVGEDIDHFTSDRFTQEDFKALKNSKLGVILDKPDFWTGIAAHVFAMQEFRIYGPLGRDTGMSPKEHLEAFFEKNPNGLKLGSTTPKLGEPQEVTFAKLALTKIFERLPQEGKVNLAMPALLLAFGGSHKLMGIGNATREGIGAIGRLSGLDEVSYGSDSMHVKTDILNSTRKQIEYILLSSMAMSSDTTSPYMPLASQLHYLMIYSSQDGQKYLQDKLAEANGDITKALSTVSKKDVAAFKKFVADAVRKIQRNPALARQLQYIMQRNHIVSDLFTRVIEEAVTAFGNKTTSTTDYGADIDALWPKGNDENVPLADSMNQTDEFHALAQVLEDMFKISPELNKSQMVEDFSRQSISYLDVQARLLELQGKISGEEGKLPEEVVVLEDVTYTPEGGEVSNALKLHIPVLNITVRPGTIHRDMKRWLVEAYGPQIYEDIASVVRGNKGAEEFLMGFVHEFSEHMVKAVDYGILMPRNIATGLSATALGIADWLAAAARDPNDGTFSPFGQLGKVIKLQSYGDADARHKAMSKIMEGLGHTAGAFTIFEGLPEIFYLSIKENLESGRYGAVVAELLLIKTLFGHQNIPKVLKWGAGNAKVALWDKALKQRGRAARLIPLGQTWQNFNRGTGVRLLRWGSGIQPGLLISESIRARKFSPLGAKVRAPLHLSITPEVGIYAGKETGAKVATSKAGKAWQHIQYEARLTRLGGSGFVRGWHAVRDTVAGFGTTVGREIVGRGYGEQAIIQTPEQAMAQRLASAQVNPNGHTTLELFRAKPETLVEVGKLKGTLTLLQEEYRKADIEYTKAEQEYKNAKRTGNFEAEQRTLAEKKETFEKAEKALKRPTARHAQLTRSLGSHTFSISNTDFIKWVKAGKVPFSAVASGKIPKGGHQELNRQFSELQRIFTKHKIAKIKPEGPQQISARSIMEGLARGRGLTHTYVFTVNGKPIPIRGDQLARLVHAQTSGKPMTFLAELGIHPNDADAIVKEISTQYGQAGGRRLGKLAGLAAKYKVAGPEAGTTEQAPQVEDKPAPKGPSIGDTIRQAGITGTNAVLLEGALRQAGIETITIEGKLSQANITEVVGELTRADSSLRRAMVENPHHRGLTLKVSNGQVSPVLTDHRISPKSGGMAAVAVSPLDSRVTEAKAAALARLETLGLEPKELAKRKAIIERTWRSARNHGPMMAIILGLDLAMNWNEIKAGGVQDAAATGAMGLGGYMTFLAGEQGISKIFKVNKGAAGPLTGATLGVALAIKQHEKALSGSDNKAKAAALADIVKEGVAGYAAVKAGTAAAVAFAENPLLAAAVGMGVGALTYGGIEHLGEMLGYKQWVEGQVAKAQIVDAFKGKDNFGIKLNVKHDETDGAYFTAASESAVLNGRTVRFSKAQQFLGIMQSATEYRKMSSAQRSAFVKNNPALGKQLGRTLSTIGQVQRLDVNSYADLDAAALDKVAAAIEQYRKDNGLPKEDPKGVRRRFDVSLTQRTEAITDPITGKKVGEQVLYDVKVTGGEYRLALSANGKPGYPKKADKVFKTASYSANGLEGDTKKMLQASIIRQTEDPENKGEYNINMQQLAAHNITLPLTRLDSFPVIKEELAGRLALMGYDIYDNSGELKNGSLLTAYAQFRQDSGAPLQKEELPKVTPLGNQFNNLGSIAWLGNKLDLIKAGTPGSSVPGAPELRAYLPLQINEPEVLIAELDQDAIELLLNGGLPKRSSLTQPFWAKPLS